MTIRYNDPHPSTDGLFVRSQWFSQEWRVRHWLWGDGKISLTSAPFQTDWWAANGLVNVRWDHRWDDKPEGDRWISQSELQFLDHHGEMIARLDQNRVFGER